MITKDLIKIKNMGSGYYFRYGTYQCRYRVYIGTFCIAEIIRRSNNWFVIYDIDANFKSLDGAVKGIVRRLNGKLPTRYFPLKSRHNKI